MEKRLEEKVLFSDLNKSQLPLHQRKHGAIMKGPENMAMVYDKDGRTLVSIYMAKQYQ